MVLAIIRLPAEQLGAFNYFLDEVALVVAGASSRPRRRSSAGAPSAVLLVIVLREQNDVSILCHLFYHTIVVPAVATEFAEQPGADGNIFTLLDGVALLAVVAFFAVLVLLLHPF